MKGRTQFHWDYFLSAEIKLRAERRAGELIQEGERQGRGRPEKTSQDVTLSDLGITRMQSHRWQREAGEFIPASRVPAELPAPCAHTREILPGT